MTGLDQQSVTFDDQRPERPGDRPRGAPAQAVIAGCAFFVAAGFTFVELVYGIASLQHISDDAVMLPAWIALSVVMLTVGIGIGRGKLWAVRLFRWLSFASMMLYLPLLALAFYLNAGATPIDPALAFVMFVSAVVKLLPFFIIYRALRKVRWLDPASLPHEWESPYIQR